jgi:GAF domain-containing protein
VTAEVAREASAIREPGMLMQDVVNLISERFGFDHAGIFLLERSEAAGEHAAGEAQIGYAVLRAASSEGGQRMLGRGHRLRIGRQGIVGYAAATGQPRIALDVGSDAVFFDNPDLPLTRSEIALPLMVRNRVIGVLDVQSNRAAAFSDEDVSILQILADQVALAIENARLLTESQQAVRELESLYGMQIRQGWNRRLADKGLVFTYDSQGVERAQVSPDRLKDSKEHTALAPTEVVVPIDLRGQRIGALRLQRAGSRAGWTEAERELIQQTATQLALSLENARLMEEVRSQASQEELINQIVARTESSLHLETVMKTAVSEIGRLMHLSRVELRLGEGPDGNGGDGHER